VVGADEARKKAAIIPNFDVGRAMLDVRYWMLDVRPYLRI
jgi:hypothetical protein